MRIRQVINDYIHLEKSYTRAREMLDERVNLLKLADVPDEIRISFLKKEIKQTENTIFKIKLYIEKIQQSGDEEF